MTLFELIKEWRISNITNQLNSMDLDAIEHYKLEKKEDEIFLSFSGTEDPLFGRGYVLVVDKDCNIVKSVFTWIS